MAKKNKLIERFEAEVEKFNAAYPVGTKVIVTKDDGSTIESVLTREAEMLGGHTPVACVKDISGAYLLERIKAA